VIPHVTVRSKADSIITAGSIVSSQRPLPQQFQITTYRPSLQYQRPLVTKLSPAVAPSLQVSTPRPPIGPKVTKFRQPVTLVNPYVTTFINGGPGGFATTARPQFSSRGPRPGSFITRQPQRFLPPQKRVPPGHSHQYYSLGTPIPRSSTTLQQFPRRPGPNYPVQPATPLNVQYRQQQQPVKYPVQPATPANIYSRQSTIGPPQPATPARSYFSLGTPVPSRQGPSGTAAPARPVPSGTAALARPSGSGGVSFFKSSVGGSSHVVHPVPASPGHHVSIVSSSPSHIYYKTPDGGVTLGTGYSGTGFTK
jgi:hypothetical protein